MRNRPTIRPVSWFCLIALQAFAGPRSLAAPPGTLIVNVASAEYFPGAPPSAPLQVTQSNIVSTPVLAPVGLVANKSSEPSGTVPPGTMVAFRVQVENPSAIGLTNAAVTDPLDSLLGMPTGITSGTVQNRGPGGGAIPVTGSYDALSRTIRWDVAAIPAGARFVLEFSCVIDPATPDDSVIRNLTTQVSLEDPAGTRSNEVVLGVVAPALSIDKAAGRSRAEVGDPIGFRIQVSNVSRSLALHAVQVRDLLPEGFHYVEGSARLEGGKISDPSQAGKKGRELTFLIGDLPLGESRRLSYVAVPAANAEGRDGLNKAWAEGLTPADSAVSAGPAEAVVRVAGSLLTEAAVVMGRVFVDDNRNGLFDEGEIGVPSARVYLEDGAFTLTDVVGKYHFEGVRPGLHVVKADPSTLPDGLGAFASWSRSAGAAGTQFTDVGADQLFKSNIATGGWGIAVSRLTAKGIYRSTKLGDEATEKGRTREVVFPPLLASAVFSTGGVEIIASARTVVEAYASLIRERGGHLLSLEVVPSFYPMHEEALMGLRADRLRAEIGKIALAAAPERRQAPRVAGGEGASQPGEIGVSLPAAPVGSAGGLAPAAGPAKSAEIDALEARVKEMTPEPAVLAPRDGEALSAERAIVEVKLPAGLTPRLLVNGEQIGDDQIAVRMETSRTLIAFFRYLGVPFKEGRNSLVLEGVDQWGNSRAWVERIVNRVGQPARLVLRPDDSSLKADGRTPVEVRVEVRDELGLPVRDGTLVTMEVDAGQFMGNDAAPDQEGFQTTTHGGLATAHLAPMTQTAKPTVTARAGTATGDLSFSLTPELRDWIVAGVGEAGVGHRGLAGGSGSSDALTLSDVLEDSAGAGGRMAFFAKGRMFSSSAMTLAYDSGRERDRDTVFRQLAPDRFFPIYGDSSDQGYAVDGQGKFSLRLDQPRSTFALGDFTTGLAGGDLLRYDRALTGGAGRVELKRFSLQSFGATTPQTQIRDELPGAGVSGPYRLSHHPAVANSERVVVETRDRFHEERLLASKAMSRFADYDIDYGGGTVLFKQPVPFQDDDFNPTVIVVLYETLDGDDMETVAGGRMGYRFGKGAEIGTTYVSEGRTGGAFVLRGADFRMKHAFSAATLDFSGEAASSESGASDPSGAVSFRAGAHLGASVNLAAHYRNVSSGFANPSRTGLSDAGTLRWGIEGQATLTDKSLLKGELFTQREALRDQERRVGSLDWEKTMGKVTARSGFKDLRALDSSSGETERSRLLTAGASLRLSERLEGALTRQQVVAGAALTDYPTRTSLGMSYRMTQEIRGFLRQEFDQADAGASSRTVVGMESHLTRNTVMDSRYSLEDALSGARGVAQLGLRTRLPLNQDWLGDLTAERVAVTRGPTGGDFTTFGVGFEYLPARIKFTTRYELRLGQQEDLHAVTAGGATRLTDSLSLFTRQRIFFVNPEQAASHLDGDGLIGLAYRPVSSDKLNFLVKLQGLKGDGALAAGSPLARSYLGILEANYEPAPRLHLLGRLATKESRDLIEGESYSSRAWLTEARGLVDIGQRYNAGITARVMEQVTTGSRVTGLGLEGGYRLVRDTWLVGGYNFTGLSEADFGDGDRRNAGPFFAVRFKFDEETLVGLSQSLRRAGPGVLPEGEQSTGSE
jgi:uncharacterized repeat protein (TIGR01451 family)